MSKHPTLRAKVTLLAKLSLIIDYAQKEGKGEGAQLGFLPSTSFTATLKAAEALNKGSNSDP